MVSEDVVPAQVREQLSEGGERYGERTAVAAACSQKELCSLRSLTHQSHAEFVTTRRAVAAAFAKICSAHIEKTAANAVPRPRSGTIPIQSGLTFLFPGSVSVSQNIVVPVKAAEAVEMSSDTYADVVTSSVVSTATS
jgi:hypothetical protein